MNSTNDFTQYIDVNDKQADYLEHIFYELDGEGVKEVGCVAGVGAGKTVLLSLMMLISKEELPMAKGQFACLTLTQFKSSIFPSIKNSWREHFGVVEYDFSTGVGDFVLWKEPPEDWDRPYEEPEDWKNCISFPNGWVCEVCPYLMNPNKHRGRTDDFAWLDEAFLFKGEWLTVLRGRIRANPFKFHSNFHHLFAYYSSPDWGVGGDWMFEIEESAKKNPKNYYFQQFTTFDNLCFLPPNYIENQRKSLTKARFDIEILGRRMSKISKSYYATFDIRKHTNIESFVNTNTWFIPSAKTVASCDFNAHFCSATIHQRDGRVIKYITECYVKEVVEDKTMPESLGVELGKKLQELGLKKLHITGDRNGMNQWAGLKKPQYELLVDVLQNEYQIECYLEPLGYNPFGTTRYDMMHDAFAGKTFDIYFDPVECKSTIMSIVLTPITKEYTKDKKSEHSSNPKQELATHLSDDIDYSVRYELDHYSETEESGFEMSFV